MIDQFAAAEQINSSAASRVMQLSRLPSDIVESVRDGRQPKSMTLP